MKFNKIPKVTRLLLIASLLVATISSCKKDFGDINEPWQNKTYFVTIPAVYNNIVASMQDNGRGVYTSFIYQASQLAANYAASGFRLDNQVGGLWDNYYFTLIDSRILMDKIEADSNAARMTNVKAMVKTLMAFKALKTTTLFGEMPFSQAGKSIYGAANFRPIYDKQADIFIASLADLKWAVDNFTTAADQVSLRAGETMLKGDIAKWIKFSNSLRLRYALVMREKNAAVADPIIAEVLTKPLLAPTEFVGFDLTTYAAYSVDRLGAYRGNSYVRMGSTMFSAMSSSTADDGSGVYDLRCRLFFEPNAAGKWVPFPQNPPTTVVAEVANAGIDDPYAEARLTTYNQGGKYLYSPLNFYLLADRTFPDVLISGIEISLLKAELYNRGIGGVAANPATAKQFYEEGITGSVNFWYKLANGSSVWLVNKPPAAPTALQLTTMLTNPSVAYSVTPATALSQIYKQQWIGMFQQPFDAWTLQRRTNNATPNVPLGSASPVLNMNRLVYPTGEIDSNFDNWKTITGGTDNMTVKPWFMP